MNIIQNLKATNELLLFIINKHNISLGTLLNDDGACIQDVIDNNNFLIDSGGWIGVDDELPQLFESVLTLSSKNTYQILALQEHYFFDFARNECVNINYITHWQPLPQPPKE